MAPTTGPDLARIMPAAGIIAEPVPLRNACRICEEIDACVWQATCEECLQIRRLIEENAWRPTAGVQRDFIWSTREVHDERRHQHRAATAFAAQEERRTRNIAVERADPRTEGRRNRGPCRGDADQSVRSRVVDRPGRDIDRKSFRYKRPARVYRKSPRSRLEGAGGAAR